MALIPAVAAWRLQRAAERGASSLALAGWFGTWILFLPNAPYILTDFLHLRLRPPIPLWYDIALLGSFAGTGLLLAYTSLADVQTLVARRTSTLVGWAVALGALLLSGFGIYLGRFLRWNSWDALMNPLGLFADIAQRVLDPFSHPRTLGVTVLYGAGLSVGYVAVQLLRQSEGTRQPPL